MAAAPYHADGNATIYHGDARHLPLADASVDAIVCDPPYELGFMGRSWDSTGVAYDVATWREALRVLKPGGHMLAFGGSRTWHRLAVAIEDAGFEIRDSMAWMYGSGFPKSLDVAKAIDKAAGATREVVATIPDRWAGKGDVLQRATQTERTDAHITAPATDDARRWQGWGTALKPGFEPIVVARKPLQGTVAANVLTYGTGALNIDGCRTAATPDLYAKHPHTRSVSNGFGEARKGADYDPSAGRWPPNVVLSHAPLLDADGCVPGCPVAELDAQSGVTTSRASAGRQTPKRGTVALGDFAGTDKASGHDDSGGASRFFPAFRYQAKAPSKERPKVDGVAHPTVKPLALMRWLCRLVTPPSGVVLDPFAGSGTTIEAALLEGFRVVGVEQHAPYLPLIQARIARVGVTADQSDIFENMPTVA